MPVLEFDQLVSNIIDVYSQASTKQIKDGKLWYSKARQVAKRVAKNTDLTIETVAGIISVISPGVMWDQNVQAAEILCNAYYVLDGLGIVERDKYDKLMTLTLNIKNELFKCKAVMILLTGEVKPWLKGQKVEQFYTDIIDKNSNGVTIDGHAKNLAYNHRVPLGTKEDKGITTKEYLRLQCAYMAANERVNLKRATQLQAITWLTWRELP
jgi:hypothetical protein